MKCIVCEKEISTPRTRVCSDKCREIHERTHALTDKYFPFNGCENCLNDLHKGCTEKCRAELQSHYKFGRDLWELIHFMTGGASEIGKEVLK